jgi:hypothetical protein
VILFFWPIRASSCHHSSISVPGGSLSRIAANSAGKFLAMSENGVVSVLF